MDNTRTRMVNTKSAKAHTAMSKDKAASLASTACIANTDISKYSMVNKDSKDNKDNTKDNTKDRTNTNGTKASIKDNKDKDKDNRDNRDTRDNTNSTNNTTANKELEESKVEQVDKASMAYKEYKAYKELPDLRLEHKALKVSTDKASTVAFHTESKANTILPTKDRANNNKDTVPRTPVADNITLAASRTS